MPGFGFPRLENKRVLVTGASAGIGAATAILFARSGANVVLAARRADKLSSVREECVKAHKEGGSSKGGSFEVVELDASKREAIDAAWPKITERGLDILINNAGGVRGREQVGDIASEDIDIMFDLNVTGLIHITQLAVKHFKQQNSGHIINLGSVAGREPYGGGSIYCATKAAVRSLTGSLLRELVSTPIRVSEVQPGAVQTEFSTIRFRGDQKAADAVYEGMTPLTGEDIAEEILWIASRPAHVNVAESFVLPVSQASPALMHREKK